MRWLKLFENFQNLESIILVGGGISSLYCAYKIKKKFPNKKITIIEKDSELGGRIKMDEINNIKIPTGAQFLRLDKDKTLQKLLKDLDIEVNPYTLEINYTFDSVSPDKFVKKLKDNLKDFDRSKFTFKEFAKSVLKEDYTIFINLMGYTDFEMADFVDTIQNYGIDDNIPGYKAANVDWNQLINKLVKEIGEENIILDTPVKSIKKTTKGWNINSKMDCDGLILGLTIKELRKLLDDPIYNLIESQKFIKVFAQVEGLESVKKYTVVDSPLRKVIPIKKDIFTIAFSDNKEASNLKNKTKADFKKYLESSFDSDIKILKLKKFFWDEGTHFYLPLNKKFKSREEFIHKAQHPDKNLWVIGECVALKQGWVEGALSSVDKIDLFD